MEEISFCRYFGESRSVPVDPEEAKIYYYEQTYMSCYCAEDSSHLLDEEMDWYDRAGLSGFCGNDSTPYSLKAHLYVSYCCDNEDATPEIFKRWYKNIYMKEKISGSGKIKPLIILILFCVTLFSSCTYHKVEPDDWKLKIGLPELQKAPNDMRVRNPIGSTHFIDKGTLFGVLNRVSDDDGNEYYLVTDKGNMLLISMYSDLEKPKEEKYINKSFRHYIKYKSMVGKPLKEAVNEWGDYLLLDKSLRLKGGYTVIYPHIYLLDDGYYTRGVQLEIDENWIVREQSSDRHVQSNLFGKLPFFNDILAWNLHEYITPPLLVNSAEESVRNDGFFASLIYGTIAFLLIMLPAILLAFFVIPIGRKSGIGLFLYLPIYLPYAYIALLLSLNEYHSAWWVLSVVYIFILLLPLSAAGFAHWLDDSKCPACGARSWKKTRVRDRRKNIIWPESYPKLTLGYDSYGRISLDDSTLDRTMHWSEPVIDTFECKKCGHIKKEHKYVDHTTVGVCPRCGSKNVPYHFENIKISGLHITGKYVEKCQECGCESRSNIDMYGRESRPCTVAKTSRQSSEPSQSDRSNVRRIPANCRNFSFLDNRCCMTYRIFENAWDGRGICSGCSMFEPCED